VLYGFGKLAKINVHQIKSLVILATSGSFAMTSTFLTFVLNENSFLRLTFAVSHHLFNPSVGHQPD
jgi:hypothetical protein